MSRREYRFHQVDVFTDRALAGNPLAVFPDPDGLPDALMQAIAREMNLSETTFVFPPLDPACVARVRIFTPQREIPFAGHPTIGTAHVLATLRRLPPGARRFRLEEGVGPIEVRLDGDASDPGLVWMCHPPATFGPEQEERPAIADALGLSEADLLPGAPIQTGSTGSTFVYVPLRNRDAVDRATADASKLRRHPAVASTGVFVFAVDPDRSAARVYSRMFAPHTSGVPEDPATGSASGPLGAYLVRHGLVVSGGEARILSEQGTLMGRQSFIHIRGRVAGRELTEIMVGGHVVPVLDGTLRLPR
jgi:trans-2,3-dihydro-3-hydroxyanthranilate isomerase